MSKNDEKIDYNNLSTEELTRRELIGRAEYADERERQLAKTGKSIKRVFIFAGILFLFFAWIIISMFKTVFA